MLIDEVVELCQQILDVLDRSKRSRKDYVPVLMDIQVIVLQQVLTDVLYLFRLFKLIG